ncbi:MAG: pitrilysin family protein [Planctomycetota bacterium]|nr:pitrilysin family protein [Planctomycetota bacterium]
MYRALTLSLLLLPALAASCTSREVRSEPRAEGPGLSVAVETYALANGLRVTLYEDHSIPRVVIDTWYRVGSQDEAPGRTGFAHLFEHLMFMGTERAPDFDAVMAAGGGSNNASTSTDRTNYFSLGPSAILPTLLWLDADRLEALAENMTQEKLDLQREVVRNERRQTSENTPYGIARLMLPALLFPEGHPYHHSVIGSHEDLQAATVADVVEFFEVYYVPSNASLVVAGDFDPDEVRAVIERTFGALPYAPAPVPRYAPPVRLEHEVRAVEHDQVQFPRLILCWHSPAYFGPGDGEMDILGEILASGPSSRLQKRLVIDRRLATEVEAYQASRELGSVFHVEAVAAPGVDLDTIKAEILDVLAELESEGPSAAEMTRAQAALEAQFLQRMEGLYARADRINSYLHFYGQADGFQRDLERWTTPTAEDVRRCARDVFSAGRVDLRILPEGTEVDEAWLAGGVPVAPRRENALDERPSDFAPGSFEPAEPETFALSNGVQVIALPRPGRGLFEAQLICPGGAALVRPEKAGLASLTARLFESGAGGLDASEFASSVASLGASIGVVADRTEMTVTVSGLSSRLDETLDRFADVVLRPNMTQTDFEREKALALAAIEARADDPVTVSGLAIRAQLFGDESAVGRSLEGYAETVQPLTLDDVIEVQGYLLRSEGATLVFAGDFSVDALRAGLEKRLGTWRGARADFGVEPLVEPPPGKLVLVDRPGSPQTVIAMLRPASPVDAAGRAARDCIETLFGRTFTSRLNLNLREEHGYTYGAFCRIYQQGEQHLLFARSSVRTDVTGAALAEFKREFDAIAAGDVTAEELGKATEIVRGRLVATAETTGSLADAFVGLVRNGRPLDAISTDLEMLAVVDLEAINALARSGLFDWSSLLVVLVGDGEAVLPQLREAGFPEPLRADSNGRSIVSGSR